MQRIRVLSAVAALIAASLFTTVQYVAAQGGGAESNSQKQIDLAAVRAERKAVVSANMNLTQDQASAFWPIYDAYEAKMDKIDDRHIAEVRAYAQHFASLTDQDATAKLDEVIAIREARLDLQKEYIPKFRAAVSSIVTTRFFQIDNKLEAMLQCDIAQNVPLAGSAGQNQGGGIPNQ
jgi:hypothetical protein